MAGIVGDVTGLALYGNNNPYISTDLNELTEVVSQFDVYDIHALAFHGSYDDYRIAAANTWGIVGQLQPSFRDDYYERIHISPPRIELGTVASSITREISVWNAYTTTSATLDGINILNGAGISLTGSPLPVVFSPLQELFWTVTITPNGPPEINAQVQFDFSDVTDPLAVIIVGNRAVVLPAVPEVPVRERWKWLTDEHVSVDGTEQRVGLRAVPRRSQMTDLVFEDEDELRAQYKTLLSAKGRLFIPYFQYATVTTAGALAGESVLAFDTGPVDLRDDDYVLLIMGEATALIQLDAIGGSTATTKAPLSNDVPKGTKVIAIYPSILPNNLNLQRAAVNNYGTMSLTSDATYPRSSFQRPGSTATLRALDGYWVLERRPMANEGVGYGFDTGQEVLDAQTGLFDVFADWDFTKVQSEFEFLARRVGSNYSCDHRTGVQEMDYWRLFFDEMKGSLNNFLLSTYRGDQVLSVPVGTGADSAILAGGTYADDFWPALAYHYISINTAAGAHLAKVTAASKNVDGDTAITFEPSLPSGPGWTDVRDISYLLKQRIVNDEVELEHHALETIFRFGARAVKE